MDGVTNIIASVLYLISITLICMKSPKRRSLDQQLSKRGGTFDTDEDLRAPDSLYPNSLSRDSGDIEAHSSKYNTRENEGLAEEIELYSAPRKNVPSYDLNHLLVEDEKHFHIKPFYSFQTTTFGPVSSFEDNITPLKTSKGKMKRSSQKSNGSHTNSFMPLDAFDEFATRQTVLFSPIHIKKINVEDTKSTSSYDFNIIDKSLETLMSSVNKKRKEEEIIY